MCIRDSLTPHHLAPKVWLPRFGYQVSHAGVSRFYGTVEWNGAVEWNSGMVDHGMVQCNDQLFMSRGTMLLPASTVVAIRGSTLKCSLAS